MNAVAMKIRSRISSMSAELWKSVFDWATVVLIALTVFSGAGALITGGIISRRQDERLRQFDKDLTGARTELGKQQERAANADARVASLEQAAAVAKATQQRVETELEAQKERTAKAQKDASDAALALARFKEPRTIRPERQEGFIAALKPFARQKFALAVFPDPEPLALARTLDSLAKSAAWQRVPAQIQRAGGVLVEVDGESAASIFDSGVAAYIAPDDNESIAAQHAFCVALASAGIPCETHRTPQLAGKTPRAISISVGKKP
jgi:hypothetical protein